MRRTGGGKAWLWLGGVALVAAALLAGASSQGANAGGSADWPAYLMDAGHSSYNAAATAITPAQVAAGSLNPVWRFFPPAAANGGVPNFWGSPTTANGVVYMGDGDGRFDAIRESDQTLLWSRFIGIQKATTCSNTLGIYPTATVLPAPGSGVLTVYENAPDGYIYALNAATGDVEWKTQLDSPSTTINDYFAWGSPVIANGKIYVGISSNCDKPLVVAGVASFDLATGAPIAVWHSMVNGAIGASVWSSPSVMPDGSVVVTTGNDAVVAQTNWAESIVRLDGSTLHLIEGWQVPLSQQGSDADFGATATAFTATFGDDDDPTPMVGACNKNGFFYAFREHDVDDGPAWQYQVGAPPLSGSGKCLAGAIWDGSRLIVAGGDQTTIGGVTYAGSVRSLNPATGAPIWQTGIPGGIVGSPSENGAGLIAAPVFAGSSGIWGVYLLRASDGVIVGFIPTPSAQWGQPVFSNGDLLVGGGTAVGLTAYDVTTPGPAVTGVSPNFVAPNQTKTVTITGSGFSGTPNIFVSGINVTVSNVHVVNSTRLTASLRAVGSASLGARNLIVVEPGNVADSCTGCLSVSASTTTTVGTSASPAPAGSPVTFTAVMSPSDGGGSVAFTSDGTTIAGCGAQPLALVSGNEQATCTTSSLAAGTHAIAATYTGDASYSGSTGTLAGGQVTQSVTTTTLASSANPLAVGFPVTFTATVSPSDGSGTVAFASDGSTISGCGSQPLVVVAANAQATCTTTALTVGTHTIAASFTGDTADAASIATLAGGQVTTGVVPGVPTGLAATVLSTTSVSVSWNAVPGATRYYLFEGTVSGGPYTQIASPTATNKTVTGLDPGATYYFVVKSNNGYKTSAASTEVSAVPATVPAAPAGLSATTASESSINLGWGSVVGATKYFIYQATTHGGPYTKIATATTTSRTVTGLAQGTAYYFVVQANNGFATSVDSNEATATTTTVPAAPTSLNATVLSPTSISLTWNAVTGATRYFVFQATTSGGPYTQIATPTATNRTVTGLTSGTTYYFVVKANNGYATSVASNEANATVAAVPSAPAGLGATTVSDTSISLTWGAVTGATKYYVFQATSPGGPYTKVATVTATTRLVTGLTAATAYYFVVQANNGYASSANSNEATAPTAAVPAAPTGLSATAHSSNSISLTWDAVTGATKYYVYEASVSGGPYTQVAVVSGTTGRTITGLTSGTTYYFVVKAYNGYAYSAASNEASAATA
jgi:fibronectin type 3 domain-containing protein